MGGCLPPKPPEDIEHNNDGIEEQLEKEKTPGRRQRMKTKERALPECSACSEAERGGEAAEGKKRRDDG